jgi:serine protease inhibitor
MITDDRSADHPLFALTREPARTTWSDPVALRRTAHRRRRRRRVTRLLAAGAVVATVTTAVTVAALDDRTPSEVQIPVGVHAGARIDHAVQLVSNVKPAAAAAAPADERAVVRAEQAFTFALLRQLNPDSNTGNVVLSPSSLAIALSMLENGAAGSTRQQIAAVLQTTGLTNEQVNAGWASLVADLDQAARTAKVNLASANSLWLQQNLSMERPFMDALARYFRTGVWQVDFAGDLSGAAKAINTWVGDNTHGKITQLFDPKEIDESTVAVIANAMYFQAAWRYAFDGKLTRPGDFYSANGRTTTVPYMSPYLGRQVESTIGADYMAVRLPYTSGRFAALAIMPTGPSLASFVRTLGPARLREITAGLRLGRSPLFFPRFTLEQHTNLNDVLTAMGMSEAFGARADFSAMSPEPLMVQNVVQRAYLHVDEQGTVAAAVSGIAMMPTSAAPAIRFDRPFLFLVQDTTTGAILVAAQVQQPQG